MRILTTSIASAAVAALAIAACGKLDEGVNVHDLTGKVVIPDAVLGTNDEIGMIVVGVYSGVDTRLGYSSPVTAPAQSSAGADAFPYGGTTIGTYQNRDIRRICQAVTRTKAPELVGTNWELEFEILQFPFYEGATVWAYVDQRSTNSPAFTTCNSQSGYSDYPQVPIDLLAVTETANEGEFVVEIDQALNYGGFDDGLDPCTEAELDGVPPCVRTYLLDEGTNFWEVNDINDVTHELTVVRPIGGPVDRPLLDAGGQAKVFRFTNDPNYSFPDYGTHHNDLLNFPAAYITPGDLVSDGATKLNDLSSVTVTIDQVVP